MQLSKPTNPYLFEQNLPHIKTVLNQNPLVLSVCGDAPPDDVREPDFYLTYVYASSASIADSLPAQWRQWLKVVVVDEQILAALAVVQAAVPEIAATKAIDLDKLDAALSLLFLNLHIPKVQEVLKEVSWSLSHTDIPDATGGCPIDVVKLESYAAIAAKVASGFICETGNVDFPRLKALAGFAGMAVYAENLSKIFYPVLVLKANSIVNPALCLDAKLWLARSCYNNSSIGYHNEKAYEQAVAQSEEALVALCSIEPALPGAVKAACVRKAFESVRRLSKDKSLHLDSAY